MPIAPIALQRRLVEVGRIRLGEKVPSSNGRRPRPSKLDKFRLTSRDKERLDAAAELYGGTVRAWEGQWELYTDAEVIPIAVVPRQALSVSYELWGQKKKPDGTKTGVICLRRCDGEFETKSQGPCLCAREPDMQCKPTTRVSVILTQVPGLGVWRVESKGWNALYEMQGTIELLEALVETGRPIRTRLRADKRETVTEEGTNKFVVPVIDIDHTMGQVLDAIGIGQGPALDVGNAGELPARGMTPVPALPAGERPSVADQVAAAGELERKPRSNAAEPIRSSGVEPSTLAERSEPAGSDGGGVGASSAASSSRPATSEEGGSEGPPSDDGPGLPLPSQVSIWIKDVEPEGLDSKQSDSFRHSFLEAFSDGEYSSAKDVPHNGQVIAQLRGATVRFKRGLLELVQRDDKWILREKTTGLPSTDPGGQAPGRRGGATPVDDDGQGELEVWDEARWRRELESVPGIGPAKLLTRARAIAGDLGVDPPKELGLITDPQLVPAVRAWLAEQAAA